MSLYMITGLIGLLYTVIFGGMTIFRRESLSTRFAIESVCLTAIFTILAYLTPIQINPLVFLILLYLITMRVRILSDLGIMFARRGNYTQAEKIYNFAAHLWPDQTGDLIIKVNLATLLLQKKQLNEAISLFTEVLSEANSPFLGVKYEAAAHYNLGVAYLRDNNNSKAMIEFNNVLDTWPASLYARRASEAMERLRKKSAGVADEKPADS
jgi:tetratricopeptide (TPR) repeat protein